MDTLNLPPMTDEKLDRELTWWTRGELGFRTRSRCRRAVTMPDDMADAVATYT